MEVKIVQFPAPEYDKPKLIDKMIDWTTEHSKVILISAGGIFVVLILGFLFLNRFGTSRTDFAIANSLFNSWIDKTEKEPLEKLEKIINHHPELHAKFGALVGEKLLQLKEKGALDHVKKTFKRIDDKSFYHQFAKNSITISQGNFVEALSSAKALKAAMESDRSFWQGKELVRSGSLLYAYNLLRIAVLEKKTGSLQGELKAWEDFERHAAFAQVPVEIKTDHSEAYSLLYQNFHEQGVTLDDYISYRKSVLSR